MQQARVAVDGREVGVDLSRPVDLAVALDFSGPQPRHFGAPRASADGKDLFPSIKIEVGFD